MMRQKLIIITIIIFLVICWNYTCNRSYDKIFKENKSYFDFHRKALNKVIIELEQSNLKNWNRKNELILPLDSLSESTRNILEDLGIGNIECVGYPNSGCYKNYQLTFNVVDNWNIFTLKVVQLVYSPCNKQTNRNYHYYDGSHRDFWGQGDDWFIYSVTDFM